MARTGKGLKTDESQSRRAARPADFGRGGRRTTRRSDGRDEAGRVRTPTPVFAGAHRAAFTKAMSIHSFAVAPIGSNLNQVARSSNSGIRSTSRSDSGYWKPSKLKSSSMNSRGASRDRQPTRSRRSRPRRGDHSLRRSNISAAAAASASCGSSRAAYFAQTFCGRNGCRGGDELMLQDPYSIGSSPGRPEDPTHGEIRDICETLLADLGLARSQYVAVIHGDTDNLHAHIAVANRVADGRAAPMTKERHRHRSRWRDKPERGYDIKEPASSNPEARVRPSVAA